MNIVLIRTFLEILETKNFNKAAERLHVTQSTVTVRINSLEEMLGQTLFVRSKTGAELTYAGFMFRRYAEMMIQVWEQAKQSITLPKGFTGVLNIGLTANLWRSAVDNWVQTLRDQMGSVTLGVWPGDPELMSRWLTSGLVDLAVAYDLQLKPGIEASPLYTEKIILVSTSQISYENVVEGSLIEQYVYVDWGDVFRQAHARQFPTQHVPVITFGDEVLALDYLNKRGGFGFLSLRMVAKEIDDGRLYLVPGAPVFQRQVYLAFGRSSYAADVAREAAAHLQRLIRSEGDKERLLGSAFVLR